MDKFLEIYPYIVDKIPDGVYVVSEEGFEYVNAEFKEITGLRCEDPASIAIEFLEHVHPEDRDILVQGRSAGQAGESSPPSFEIRWIRGDGTTLHLQFNTRPIPGLAGHVLGVIRDVTELRRNKQLEEKLGATLAKLRSALGATTQAITMILEQRDPYTAGHQRRVADLGRAVATELGLPMERIDAVRMAGLLHDLGKISVPSEILSKPTALTEAEFSLMKTHPRVAFDILKTIAFPWPIARIILEHHERLDGSGYPQGLRGENILLEAKILAVADVVEAMISHRPYRPARTLDEALTEISRMKGFLYDPDAVGACERVFRAKEFTFRAQSAV